MGRAGTAFEALKWRVTLRMQLRLLHTAVSVSVIHQTKGPGKTGAFFISISVLTTLARRFSCGQIAGLCDPFIARHPAFEAFQIFINPGDFGCCPVGDLVKVIKAQFVAQNFQLGANALDQFQIIRLAATRRGQALGFGRLTRCRRHWR